MMHGLLRRPSLVVALLLTASASVLAGNWPQWRGPAGAGASDETGLPVKWDATTNLLWTCTLPDHGASVPAVWGDDLFVTAHQGKKLLLLKISKADGKIQWEREVGKGKIARRSPKRQEHAFHSLHNMASPSPVTDG